MQKNFSRMLNISISALIMSFLLAGARTLLMLLKYDFGTNFYSNDYFPYFIYVVFALFAVILYLMCRSLPLTENIRTSKSIISKILEALTALIFLIFSMLFVQKVLVLTDTSSYLDRIAFLICAPTAFVSGIFFIIKSFCKKNNIVCVMALIPSVFFSILLVQGFAGVAKTAASLSYFPDIISTLILAFYLLNRGKALLLNNNEIELRKTFTSQCITFISLSFSAIPDTIFFLANRIEGFDIVNILLLFIKLVFMVYVAVEAISFMKGIKDR